MRVFVVGTGRCGSVSFSMAAKMIRNFTCEHESESMNLEYPDNHIEVNTQLRSCLHLLRVKYPDAFFVHLKRERSACVESLAALDHGEVMAAYRRLHQSIIPTDDPKEIAERFYDWENTSIAWQLADRVRHMQFRLEEHYRDWELFWGAIKAEGDYGGTLDSWAAHHNTREQRGET